MNVWGDPHHPPVDWRTKLRRWWSPTWWYASRLYDLSDRLRTLEQSHAEALDRIEALERRTGVR